MKSIGILLPQSKAYPKISKDFMKGLRLALQESVELKIEGIGYSSDPKAIIDSIQKLVNQEDVSLLTGLLGHFGIEEICDFVEDIDETLIYADLGATIPPNLSERKKITCNSLGLVDSIGKLGKYLVDKGNTEIGISTCYNDAGYGFIQSMEHSIYSVDAKFSGHFITPLNPRENEAELMSNFTKETDHDAIFCSHNGIFAKEHATFLAKNKIYKETPIYGTQFSFSDDIINEFSDEFDGIKVVSPWLPSLKNEQNNKFINDYSEAHNSTPSVFSLLGYENGLIINNQLQKPQEEKKDNLIGPRGSLSINNTDNRITSPAYLWEIKHDNKGNNYQFIEEIKNVSKLKDSLSSNSKTSGWHNAYLCH